MVSQARNIQITVSFAKSMIGAVLNSNFLFLFLMGKYFLWDYGSRILALK